MTMLRKLAREATIFALLGMLVASIGIFVVTDRGERASARKAAEVAVHADDLPVHCCDTGGNSYVEVPDGVGMRVFDSSGKMVAGFFAVPVTLSNGTKLSVRPCVDVGQLGFTGRVAPMRPNCWPFRGVSHQSMGLGPEPDPDLHLPRARSFTLKASSTDVVNIEKDYWVAYKNSRHVGENLLASLLLGLWGFPGGVGLWVFYRLVRFAVKG